MQLITTAFLFAVLASSAFAQQADWQYRFTGYFWLTDTGVAVETPTGETVEAELSFSDALKNLDFALMGAFEARSGKFGLITDALYFKLSPTNTTPGPLFDDVTVRTQMSIISAYAAYRPYETNGVAVDIAGGFRWAKMESDVTTSGGLLGDSSFGLSGSWADPVIGLRVIGRLSDKMSATFFADIGGFSGDSSTWQALASIDYELNDKWALTGGYRHMELDREIDGQDFEIQQSGLLFGATYKF